MGIRLIKISVVYFVIGTILGMFMSITEDMTLGSVHAHISLMGWTTMTLSGIVYHMFPELTEKTISKVQFWLYNTGLPLMVIGLGFYIYDMNPFKVVVAIGATLTSIAILLFAINVLAGLKK